MLLYRNFIIILSSPSGAGKSSIVKKIKEWDKKIKVSISATTREPRIGEVNHTHYHFFSVEEFKKKIYNKEFLEYAQVFDNFYGTLRTEIESKFKEDHDVVMDIDWQGARQITEKLGKERLLKIFILPPSLKELENRLKARGQDNIKVIKKRISKAKEEISHYGEYDYVVVNESLDKTFEEIKSIIIAKRLGNVIDEKLKEFVDNM